MKKILSKIGKGFSKLKDTKVKAIVTAILTVIMLIDLNPFFLKAGRETLVYTFKDGIQHPYAFDNYHNSYSYYSISWMGGHVAYCMDYDIKNPPNGTGLQYIRNVKSDKVVAVLMNGYPTKTAAQLGLPNNEEAYLATQMAVWAAVNGTSETKGLYFDMNKLQPNLKYSSYTDEMVTNGKKVANQLLKTSYNPGTFSLDSSKAKVNYEYSDKQIKIGPYKAAVTGYSSLNKVNVTLSGQPTGTLLVDKNGTQKSSFIKNEEIYILVDKSLPAGSLKITASGKANKYVGVVYGKGSWQNFVFLDTEQVDVSGLATASWEESKGNIKVVKSDQDSKPVQGAEFALLDASGKQVDTGKTDANGNLQFNKLALGNYTITETSVPDGYIIQKSSYPVTVKRNQTSTVNVQNTKVKGVLQITKIEKKAKTPIQGAVFEIYDKDGKVVDKITTDVSGIATSSQLPKGTYTYKEIFVPDGYIMDTETRTFSISEKVSVVRETITNEKIVGRLQLLKIGDDGEKPLGGAEFEVYDSNKKVVAKLITDKEGRATSVDLGKGNYTYKEVKAPDGYDMDTKEYSFKIETLNQVVEQTVTDKKIYGVLKIQKVDEDDKPIADVKFEIINEENKIVATVTTDVNGIAIVENLPVGKYKYREVDTPYLYVLDEKEYNFEITSEKREEIAKVVNQRAKGILKIVKIDKDSKVAIANAKFNVIDKSNNDIVDAIVTDENGVARTKALPTGEYMYQEVEVPDDYIIDDKTYDVKIKKNNEMVEKKVSNEHKKLPVTGGFLSTDVLIIVIVTSGSVIAYIIYKIIKNKKDNPPHPDGNSYFTNENYPSDYNPNVNNEYTENINEVNNLTNSEEITTQEVSNEKIDTNTTIDNNKDDLSKETNETHENTSLEENLEIQNENSKINEEVQKNKNISNINIEDSVNEEKIENDEVLNNTNDNNLNEENLNTFEEPEDEMLDFTPKYNTDETQNKD